MLFQSLIDTPLGPMSALADDKRLYALEFVKEKQDLVPGFTCIHALIHKELEKYFQGKLHAFKTPLSFSGTPFQISVWQALLTIPFGQTRSYSDIALQINHPRAYRAVGTANGQNKFIIIVPCHRVIAADNGLGGYSCGLWRKEKLLELEKLR